MKPSNFDVTLANARAQDVVNGFIHVRMQQARDVMMLAAELREANRKLERTERELAEARLGNKAPENFGDIFGELMKGKK